MIIIVTNKLLFILKRSTFIGNSIFYCVFVFRITYKHVQEESWLKRIISLSEVTELVMSFLYVVLTLNSERALIWQRTKLKTICVEIGLFYYCLSVMSAEVGLLHFWLRAKMFIIYLNEHSVVINNPSLLFS